MDSEQPNLNPALDCLQDNYFEDEADILKQVAIDVEAAMRLLKPMKKNSILQEPRKSNRLWFAWYYLWSRGFLARHKVQWYRSEFSWVHRDSPYALYPSIPITNLEEEDTKVVGNDTAPDRGSTDTANSSLNTYDLLRTAYQDSELVIQVHYHPVRVPTDSVETRNFYGQGYDVTTQYITLPELPSIPAEAQPSYAIQAVRNRRFRPLWTTVLQSSMSRQHVGYEELEPMANQPRGMVDPYRYRGISPLRDSDPNAVDREVLLTAAPRWEVHCTQEILRDLTTEGYSNLGTLYRLNPDNPMVVRVLPDSAIHPIIIVYPPNITVGEARHVLGLTQEDLLTRRLQGSSERQLRGYFQGGYED